MIEIKVTERKVTMTVPVLIEHLTHRLDIAKREYARAAIDIDLLKEWKYDTTPNTSDGKPKLEDYWKAVIYGYSCETTQNELQFVLDALNDKEVSVNSYDSNM